jgi:uncharacterized membrane protein YedE/YeeE
MAHPATHAPTIAAAPSAGLPPWARYGIIFGIVSAVSIALWAPIGVSGTYPRLIGAILGEVNPEYAAANPYLVKMGSLLKAETFLVLGLLIGGFLASRFGNAAARAQARVVEMVHTGEKTTVARYRDAFLGGFLIIVGARIAGGCTSGHIISGITQLSVSGFIFAAGVFASGIVTAKLLHTGGK